MSKSQSSVLKSRGCYLCIAAAILLMFNVFFAFRTPRQQQTLLRIKVVPPSAVVPRVAESLASPVFDTESFYCTIIDNNLFRPLGWTPPRPAEPYRLLGTILPRSETTPPRAILQSTTGEKTYIVTTGEQLDASTEVISIEGKSVTLSTDGQQRTLRLDTGVYLNPSPATRKPRRTTDTPHRPTPIRAPVRSNPTPAPPAVPAPQLPDRPAPLSDWKTREGVPIRLGDARLKNPQKWGLRRR